MRVLLATRAFAPDVRSGAASVAEALWSRLRVEHEVKLVSGWSRDASLLPGDAVAVRLTGSAAKARLAMEFAVRRAALGFRPDIVIAQGVEVPVDLAPTIGLLGDPFAGRAHWGRLRGVRDQIIKRRVEKLAAAIVPSEAVRNRYDDFGVDTSGFQVLWPGVDTVAFCPLEPGAAAPKDPRLRLLYAARVSPEKGQHVAIEAVKGLHEAVRSKIVLQLAGPVEDAAYRRSLDRRADGAPVVFLDEAPDLVPLYRAADVVLFPTVGEEVFGYSAVHGMACGKPVIHSRVGAVEEITGGIGVSVPAGDVKRFGEAIRALVKDPERRADLGARGRALVLERYTWEAALDRYKAVVERVAG